MKRKIIGNQRRLSTGVISFISCWFRHQQCRDIQRNMSLETKTKTRKTIKKQNQANSIAVSKTTVVPCQRASERQNSSQIINLQLTNRNLERRKKKLTFRIRLCFRIFQISLRIIFSIWATALPPALTSLACYQLIVIRLGEEYVRSLLRY